MPSRLFCLRLMFERSKLESLRDVNVTRIDDTLSYDGVGSNHCAVHRLYMIGTEILSALFGCYQPIQNRSSRGDT